MSMKSKNSIGPFSKLIQDLRALIYEIGEELVTTFILA